MFLNWETSVTVMFAIYLVSCKPMKSRQVTELSDNALGKPDTSLTLTDLKIGNGKIESVRINRTFDFSKLSDSEKSYQTASEDKLQGHKAHSIFPLSIKNHGKLWVGGNQISHSLCFNYVLDRFSNRILVSESMSNFISFAKEAGNTFFSVASGQLCTDSEGKLISINTGGYLNPPDVGMENIYKHLLMLGATEVGRKGSQGGASFELAGKQGFFKDWVSGNTPLPNPLPAPKVKSYTKYSLSNKRDYYQNSQYFFGDVRRTGDVKRSPLSTDSTPSKLSITKTRVEILDKNGKLKSKDLPKDYDTGYLWDKEIGLHYDDVKGMHWDQSEGKHWDAETGLYWDLNVTGLTPPSRNSGMENKMMWDPRNQKHFDEAVGLHWDSKKGKHWDEEFEMYRFNNDPNLLIAYNSYNPPYPPHILYDKRTGLYTTGDDASLQGKTSVEEGRFLKIDSNLASSLKTSNPGPNPSPWAFNLLQIDSKTGEVTKIYGQVPYPTKYKVYDTKRMILQDGTSYVKYNRGKNDFIPYDPVSNHYI